MGYSDQFGDDNCSSFTASEAAMRRVVGFVTVDLAMKPETPWTLVLCDVAAPPGWIWPPPRFKHSGMRLFKSCLELCLDTSKFRFGLLRRITGIGLWIFRVDRHKPALQLVPHFSGQCRMRQ